jgi:subtilisin-like proprotein convertase family protein
MLGIVMLAVVALAITIGTESMGAAPEASRDDATISCKTYTSADTPLNIPDWSSTGVTSTIAVYDQAENRVTGIVLTLTISHTFDSDIEAYLVDPAGKTTLFRAADGGGINFVDTVLQNDAATSIYDGWPPFTGTFRPEADLPTGGLAYGDWGLRVIDTQEEQVGSIQDWSIEICSDGPLGPWQNPDPSWTKVPTRTPTPTPTRTRTPTRTPTRTRTPTVTPDLTSTPSTWCPIIWKTGLSTYSYGQYGYASPYISLDNGTKTILRAEVSAYEVNIGYPILFEWSAAAGGTGTDMVETCATGLNGPACANQGNLVTNHCTNPPPPYYDLWSRSTGNSGQGVIRKISDLYQAYSFAQAVGYKGVCGHSESASASMRIVACGPNSDTLTVTPKPWPPTPTPTATPTVTRTPTPTRTPRTVGPSGPDAQAQPYLGEIYPCQAATPLDWNLRSGAGNNDLYIEIAGTPGVQVSNYQVGLMNSAATPMWERQLSNDYTIVGAMVSFADEMYAWAPSPTPTTTTTATTTPPATGTAGPSPTATTTLTPVPTWTPGPWPTAGIAYLADASGRQISTRVFDASGECDSTPVAYQPVDGNWIWSTPGPGRVPGAAVRGLIVESGAGGVERDASGGVWPLAIVGAAGAAGAVWWWWRRKR